MSETKKPTPEELWEAAGYLRAAEEHGKAKQALASAEALWEEVGWLYARCFDATVRAERALPFYDPVAHKAYERGIARWRTLHPEVRA
jgi:hypothetical protein